MTLEQMDVETLMDLLVIPAKKIEERNNPFRNDMKISSRNEFVIRQLQMIESCVQELLGRVEENEIHGQRENI